MAWNLTWFDFRGDTPPEVICDVSNILEDGYPDSKVHGANMGPIWGRQDPGGPHVDPMNFVIWVYRRGKPVYRSPETSALSNQFSL